jgi:hypothetical protein
VVDSDDLDTVLNFARATAEEGRRQAVADVTRLIDRAYADPGFLEVDY